MAEPRMGTVHLVDDDPGVRDALAFLMRSRGLDVRAFASGPALLDMRDGDGPRSGPPKGVFLRVGRMVPLSGTRLQQRL